MGDPWFRPSTGFGYRAITWQGRALVAAQFGIGVPCGLVFLRYVQSKPLLGWGFGVVAVVTYFAIYAVMIWKAEFITRDN